MQTSEPEGAPDGGALSGLRVLDIGTFIAAPFAATLMGEFGAEVIKVELPKVGDHARRLGTPTEVGDTLVWLSEARNKKSVTIDLRKAEGAGLLKSLAAVSDVVCENFQAGTLERWGLGWDDLRAVNPKLILLRISGYGQTGPYASRPCFGRIANAFGGISFLSGEPDRPPAQPGSATLSDYMAGLFGAFAVQMALRARDRTGRGQVIDIALYEGIFRILDEVAPAFQRNGFVRRREGPETPLVVPHSHYPTGDGRWVAIACTNDRIFGRLAEVMGRADMIGDERFSTNAARIARRGEVNGIVADWTSGMTRDEALARCAEAEVPCGPVYAIDEIFEDPHYRARGNILYVDDPRVGRIAVPNVVPRLEGTPGQVRWLGPALGAHTDEVLSGALGLDAEHIAALRRDNVI
ncbi:CoA transferase [Enterovirga sp.]|jgi:crotonobetainyl-CoA:carnitine CoA-transferase CaiB-like acyl-CoA transferase|uniref:CaiB/BaiF CoA transferase family protein n=1 Tax=Enterovirga sp. TaxID=2026350 RepID=UPI00260AD4CF|nr:CoA transferase [Enterovirga sp.]MDB5589572.1 formyl-coenzyme transferase [Enterovirga sp.]